MKRRRELVGDADRNTESVWAKTARIHLEPPHLTSPPKGERNMRGEGEWAYDIAAQRLIMTQSNSISLRELSRLTV
jgi:hypothetical protein